MLYLEASIMSSIKKWATTSFAEQWIYLYKVYDKGFKQILIFFIAAYRTLGTIFLGGACRFHPTCSDYARQAVQIYPANQSLKIITRRLIKCHPWGSYGFDPLPQWGSDE